MSHDNKISQECAIDALTHNIRTNLENYVGDNRKEGLKEIKNSLYNSLKRFEEMGLIANEHEDGFKVGEVSHLWSRWTIKQKLKWIFYNKTPFVKTMSEKIRKEIDDYNSLIVDLKIHEKNHPDSGLIVPAGKEYPEHLIMGQKQIIVSDILVKPVMGVDFVTINFTVDNVRK